jgi:tetratricopeptide (TPR) repeat protein
MLLHPYRDPIALPAPQPGVAVEPLADYGQALAWFTTEHAALFSAAERAGGTWDAHVWQLAWTLWTFLDRRGYWHDLATIGQAGRTAADLVADSTGAAVTNRLLSCAAMRLDRYDEAHAYLHRALDLYRAGGDRAGEAAAHANFGVLCEGQRRYAEALDHAERALALYRAIGHRRGQAHGLNSVGWYRALTGDHAGGIEDCRQALVALQALGDDTAGEAMTWDSIGYAQHRLGDHQQAVLSYRQALRRYVGLGDRYSEAATLARLGDTHRSAGDHKSARTVWRAALTIFDELRHPDGDEVRGKLRELA